MLMLIGQSIVGPAEEGRLVWTCDSSLQAMEREARRVSRLMWAAYLVCLNCCYYLLCSVSSYLFASHWKCGGKRGLVEYEATIQYN